MRDMILTAVAKYYGIRKKQPRREISHSLSKIFSFFKLPFSLLIKGFKELILL